MGKEREMTPEMFVNLLLLGEADGWRYLDERQLGANGIVHDGLKKAILFCGVRVASGQYCTGVTCQMPAEYTEGKWPRLIYNAVRRIHDPRADD